MASVQAKHVISNLLKEQPFGPLCSSSLLSLALDPSIELPIERAFAHLYCVPAPLLIEFITSLLAALGVASGARVLKVPSNALLAQAGAG